MYLAAARRKAVPIRQIRHHKTPQLQVSFAEVLEAVLDYAFDRVGFNRVQAEVFYGNDASSAVLKKCGMVLEGIARQKYYKNGEYIDTALWAIIVGDRLY